MAEEQIEEASMAAAAATPFQLQFDKPIPFQIKMAEWNPEKDLLAMVTDDSKVLLHRFNWQRLWTISPGKCITSICWSPDGKIIALGTEDGLILLHDVENGKMLRTTKSHDVAIVSLNWAEDDPLSKSDKDEFLSYEDRTTRFFPPPPVMPRIGGLRSGDTGLADENEEAIPEFSSASCQRFNILCSGGKDGCVCFSVFGIFPVGKINITKIPINVGSSRKSYQLQDASVSKVSLSRNLQKFVILCFGKLVDTDNLSDSCENSGLHCLYLDTSIFFNRKNELHQVSQQASSIQDMVEVVRASVSLISKQWSNAMSLFHEKFSALPNLISTHGVESSSEDEFLSLLFGTRTSPALHHFLASSLGEAGLKRIAKAVDSAGRDIRGIITEHLQPAVEIISFRLAELRGLSRWRSRFQTIGLDGNLIDGVTESIGMLVVQVERFSRVAATVVYLFQNFFAWVLKSVRILLNEPTDQVPAANSELVVIFLKFLLDKDPIKQLLEADERIECDILKEAFLMPFTAISSQIQCQGLLPLYPVTSSATLSSSCSPTSISFYKDEDSSHEESSYSLTDYVCLKIPDGSLNKVNCIGVIKGSGNCCTTLSMMSLSGFLLHIPDGYECVDLSLYKDNQVVLLLSETSCSDSPGKSWMVMLQIENFSFMPLSGTFPANIYSLQKLVALDLQLDTDYGKVRSIPHTVSTPFAVSASRGVACVFSSRRHALVYILDEDEEAEGDETSDME
uniref:Anaphase-promoting complex subunit 4 n=1 Tax=Zea mays TaxID=4577 RepID=A0A804NX40_MAIZE